VKHQIAFSKWEWPHFRAYPLVALRERWDELRWFVQRGLYGYSQVDRWNIGPYLLEWMPMALHEMADHSMSYHPAMTHDEWIAVLRDIAEGLHAGHRLMDLEFDFHDEAERERLESQYEKATDLLAKYLMDLWD
jgi:hypothetical protein